MGHEVAGEVVEVGAEVVGIRPGMRVIVNPMTTPSRIGSGGTEGAFCERLLVRRAALDVNLYEIPEGLSYELAALTEPLSVALHGVNRMQLRPDDKVAVFGCGPIGLGMVMWLADRGLTDIVAFDLIPSRLERAKALGASHTEDLHGIEPLFTRHAVGTDAYIDAAGAPNILSDVARMAKYHSRMVITAAHIQPVSLDLAAMLTTEMTITTAVSYPTEMPEVLSALPRLANKASQLITHRLPFDDVLRGIETARDPFSCKVMIEFQDEAA